MLEGGMIKGSLARLGKTFPLKMDILPVKRLFPPRWGSRSRYPRVTTWKGQNLATVTHIHVFLSNKGKWETLTWTEHPSYHLRVGGGGQGAFPWSIQPLSHSHCLIPFIFFFSFRNSSHSARLFCLKLFFFFLNLSNHKLYSVEDKITSEA